MQVGGSAGGARPKALVLWNRSANRIRSGFVRPEPGEEAWLIKFDGVTRDSAGRGMRGERQPGPWGRIEYAYSRMASNAGIRMAESHCVASRGAICCRWGGATTFRRTEARSSTKWSIHWAAGANTPRPPGFPAAWRSTWSAGSSGSPEGPVIVRNRGQRTRAPDAGEDRAMQARAGSPPHRSSPSSSRLSSSVRPMLSKSISSWGSPGPGGGGAVRDGTASGAEPGVLAPDAA